MSVTDSGAYGALAVYSDYGKSSLVTVNTNVVSKYMLNILIILVKVSKYAKYPKIYLNIIKH